ncbi:MAG: NifU family protein [Acidimicrobiia bacterium]
MLSAAIETALIDILHELEDRQVDYCVGGSVMLALNGFDVAVGDIDIAVPSTVRALVDPIFPVRNERERTELWRSDWSFRTGWEVGSQRVAVDLIGGLRVLVDGAEASFPVMAERWATIGDIDVAVAPLRHWYHLYRMHRPGKAAMIASRLSDAEIVAGAHELGIGDSFSPTLIVRIGNESHQQRIETGMSTEQQSSIIEVASPTDHKFDEEGASEIDLDLLNETLEYIRPALQADGGDLILLGTEGGKVVLQMVGACGGCPLSTMTLTAGIERIVQDRVPGVTEVVSV